LLKSQWSCATQEKSAWFEKGSGTFAGTARRVLRTKVPDPFSTQAEKSIFRNGTLEIRSAVGRSCARIEQAEKMLRSYR